MATIDFHMERLKSSGFTLVEILISLSIFALLLTSLLWGFRQGLLNWEQAKSRQFLAQQLLSRHLWLENWFNQTILSQYTVNQGFYLPYFKADASAVNWMSATSLLDVNGHIYPLSLKWDKIAENDYALLYQAGAAHSDPYHGTNLSSNWIELLHSPKIGKFSYYAPAFPVPEEFVNVALNLEEQQRYRDEPEWLDNYDTELLWKMPLQVKLEFIDLKQQPHIWLFTLPNRVNSWGLDFYDD